MLSLLEGRRAKMVINRNIINILNCIIQGTNKLGHLICSLYAEITDTYTVFMGNL